MPFISVTEWAASLARNGLTEELAQRAIEVRLLPIYKEHDDLLIWENDLVSVPIEWSSTPTPGTLPLAAEIEAGEAEEFKWSVLRFSNGIKVTFPPYQQRKAISGLAPALRQLARLEKGASTSPNQEILLADKVYVTLGNSKHISFIKTLAARLSRVSHDRSSELTKSASYMGSKYSLASFLVEGIATALPSNGVVVDLMCGAGSATRAFSLNWNVMASDAMSFCSCLASSFGHRGEEESILNMLPQLHLLFRQNLEKLEAAAHELIETEEELLHSNLGFDDGLIEKYTEFVEQTPRFPEGGSKGGWSPAEEALHRQVNDHNRQEAPYCLVLSYFGNVYFGLRQSIELDSLRFAIDQLEVENTRTIALAALVATASYISTGYASQFAQPVNVGKLSQRALYALLEKRAIRVLPEFVARLTALAEIATETSHPVHSYTGTWEEALKQVPLFAQGRTACIYLDAPYTRDEYARYYHVLETLCRYHYPDSVGRGRTPNRKTGQIFKSPFFTRKDSAIGPLLSNIIVESLRRAEFCAWSYSSRARASIPEVVQSVLDQGGDLVETFSIPHRYSGQGRTDNRVKNSDPVDEYLLIFSRNNITAAN